MATGVKPRTPGLKQTPLLPRLEPPSPRARCRQRGLLVDLVSLLQGRQSDGARAQLHGLIFSLKRPSVPIP